MLPPIHPEFPQEAQPVELNKERVYEVSVKLQGQEHLIKVYTADVLDNPRVEGIIKKHTEFLSKIVGEVGLSESLTLEITDRGELKNVALLHQDAKLSEKIGQFTQKYFQGKPNQVENRLRELSLNHPELTESKIKMVALEIILHSSDLIQAAEKAQDTILRHIDPDIQLAASKSGALSIKVGSLGGGIQKDVSLFAKIGKMQQIITMETGKTKLSAIDRPKQDVRERRKLSEEERKNELELHRHLNTIRKTFDLLPHVAISKVIRYHSNSGICEVLKGKVYNGGDLNRRPSLNL